MGPGLSSNNTITKTRDYLSSIKPYHYISPHEVKINLLNDGRIICFEKLEREIKIYKIINNNFSLELTFNIEFCEENKDRGPCIMYELEDNIILFGAYMELNLIDINNNQNLIQKVKLNYEQYIYNILKLSNELIAINNVGKIYFFSYDTKTKKLDKKDELKIGMDIYEISQINDRYILICTNNKVFLYNINNKENKEIILDKNYKYWAFKIIDNYLFASYSEDDNNNVTKSYIDIYKITLEETFQIHQKLKFDYPFWIIKFLKINENKLIAGDSEGNFYEFKISENFQLINLDLFKAHDYGITHLCKFTDNKIISTSKEGIVKLWEFN